MQALVEVNHRVFSSTGEAYQFAGEFSRDVSVLSSVQYQPYDPKLALEDLIKELVGTASPIAAYREKSTTPLFKALALATTAVVAISSFAPHARAIDWDGSSSDAFAVGDNWAGDLAPTGADTATIGTNATNATVVSANENVNDLNVTGTGDLTINAGNTLTVNVNTTIDSATAVIQGAGTLSTLNTYQQTNGTVSVTNLRAQNFDIDAGTVSTGLRAPSAPAGQVNVDIDGGTFNATNFAVSLTSNNNIIDVNITGATITNKTASVISTNSGTANTTIFSDVELTSTGSLAIDAQSSSGNIEITSNADVAGITQGVHGQASSSGNVSIGGSGNFTSTGGNFAGMQATTDSGAISIFGSGNAQGSGVGAGLQAQISNAAATTDINVTRTGTFSGGTGLNLNNNGTGAIIVNGVGNITAGTGISATSFGGGNVDITTGGTINGTNATAMNLNTLGGGGAGTITVTTGGAMGDAGALSVGVIASNNGGSGTITMNNGHDMTLNTGLGNAAYNIDSGTGLIDVNITNGTLVAAHVLDLDASGAGNIDVDATGGALNGTTTAIAANSAGGTVDVNINGATIGSTTGDTINASTTGAGTVTVSTETALTSTGAQAIDADSVNGAIEITANGNVTGTNAGIDARTTGTGGITIVGTGQIEGTGADGDGINATSNSGGVTILGTGNTVAAGAGHAINADITTGASNINITRSGTITGGSGGGIDALNAGTGNVSITGTGNATASGGNTIRGGSTGGGNITIDVAGTVDNTNAISNGIQADTTGAGTVDVDIGGAIGGTNAPGTGINTSAVNGTTTINADQNITAGQRGIDANASGTGLLDVNQSAGTITSGNIGLDVDQTGTGNIDIDITGGLIDAATNVILADANSGNVNIDISGAAFDSTTHDAIRTSTGGSGNITIVTSTALTSTGADGIETDTVNGNIDITANNSVTANSAIDAVSTGSGTITIAGTGNTQAQGTNASGIIAQTSTGAINISGTGNSSATGTGTAINADITSALATTDITITRSGTITGGSGGGIITFNNGSGNVSITGTGNATATSGNTLLAQATGGNVTIDTAGTIDNSNAGGIGINAVTSGAGTVTVDIAGAIGATNAPGRGINTSAENGQTTINADQNITSSHTGIDANGTGMGLIDINVSAGTITSSRGLDVDQAGTGSVDIDVTGGTVTSTTNDAINVATTSGTIDVLNAAGASIIAQDPNNGSAIDFSSNANVVQTLGNSGTIQGRVTGDDGALTFTNNAGGEWIPSGDDGGTFTSNFGTGTDTVNNAGTVKIADTTAALNAALITFSGLENFTNTGTINLQNGGTPLTTDRLTVTPTGGQLLTFTGGGTINLDADLGGGGTADLVTLGSASGNNATVTGATTLNINNTNPGGTGTIGETITVVRVADNGVGTGTTAASFTATPVKIGNVQYALQFVDNDASGFDLFQLVGEASTGAAEIQQAQTQTASMNLFHDAVNAMVDRQGDVRDNVAEYGKSGGFWMHTFGGAVDRTARGNAVTAGATTTSDTSYDQVTYGIYAGVDKAFKGITKDNDYLMVGVYGGYLGAKVDFKANSSKITYGGATLGAYSTYIDNGFYLDTLVKADILDANITDGPNNASAKTDVMNYGGRIGFGYKIEQAGGTYIDPFGKLTYVHAKIDDYTIGANAVSMDSGDSLRGQFGARLGKQYNESGTKYDAFITASLIHEFDGKSEGTVNAATNISEDNDLTLLNLGVGVDVEMPMDGVNFYARANTDIGDDYFGYSGKVGFNIKI